MDFSRIEQGIYEAAIIPDQWPEVLSDIARATEARGGVLFSVTDATSSWTSSAGVRDLMSEFVTSGWVAKNPRMEIGFRRELHLQPRFVVEADFFDDRDLSEMEIYRDFYLPIGLGHSAGTVASLPHGDMLCFSFERDYDRGPFSDAERRSLDGIRPHLMRASMLTARLGMERVRTAVETLAQLGFAAAAVALDGRTLVTNDAFDQPEHPWTTRGRDRIALNDAAGNEMLQRALSVVATTRTVRSIPIRSGLNPTRHVVHVVPVRRSARDIFTDAGAILIFTGVRSEVGDPAVLQLLFDLTNAEALLARRIAAGQSLEAVAAETGRSIATVRNQLSAVLTKTGCSRQAELSAVLNGLLPPSR